MEDKRELEQEYDQCSMELRKIEETYDEIDAALRKAERQEDEYQFIYSETNGILDDLSRYWGDKEFCRELDLFEEELFETNREIQRALQDKKENLQNQRKSLRFKEEEYSGQMIKLKAQLEGGCDLWGLK